MEGIGNFSVKRKRNLDPLDISEIIVAKKKKKKWMERWIGPATLRNIFEYGKVEGKN